MGMYAFHEVCNTLARRVLIVNRHYCENSV